MSLQNLKMMSFSFMIVFFHSISFGMAEEGLKIREKRERPKVSAQGNFWAVNCKNTGKNLHCSATQRLHLKKNKKLLLALTIQRDKKQKTSSMLIQLPHHLYLPAGVKMQIDRNKASQLAIQTCDTKGCYAGLALSIDKIKQMSKAAKLKIVFQNLKKKNITVSVSLQGFEVAYKKL